MMRRNREINIFNLSMMDVISGAMGAFLIIMVVLARYYKSDPSSSQSVDEMAEQIRRAIEQLDQAEDKLDTGLINIPDLRKLLEETRRRLEDAERRLQDLRERLNQAAAQIERLNTAVDQLKAENAALQAEVQQLRAQTRALEQQLAQAEAERDQAREMARRKEDRRPFLVTMLWRGCNGADVDLYVRDINAKDEKGNFQPEVNPYQKQVAKWAGDTYRDGSSPANASVNFETWLVRDAPIGTTFAVYYKLMGFRREVAGPQVCNVLGEYHHEGRIGDLTSFDLSLESPVAIAGYLTMSSEGQLDYRKASDVDYAALFAEIEKMKAKGSQPLP